MFIGVLALKILFDTGTSMENYYSTIRGGLKKNKTTGSTKSVDVKNIKDIYKAFQRLNTKD